MLQNKKINSLIIVSRVELTAIDILLLTMIFIINDNDKKTLPEKEQFKSYHNRRL